MKLLFTLLMVCVAINAHAGTYLLLSQTNAFAAGITNEAKAYADTKCPNTLAGVTNALGLTGSTTTFLRSDGTQVAPSGGTTNMMVSTITSGTTISPTFAIAGLSTNDASCRRVTFRLAIAHDVTTISAPAGTLIDGDTMVWEVIQDAGTLHTISGWDTGAGGYKFGTDITGITLTATLSARDFITFTYNSTANKWYCVGFVRGY